MREPPATDDNVLADEVSPDELLTTVIPLSRRGYSPDVIDSLLERAAATIERLRALDDPALERERRERADLMQRTLMLAQTRADETITEAQTIAGEIRADAEASAQLLVADAEQIAAHLVETERARARSILEDALACRDVLTGDIEALEQFALQARARLRDALAHEVSELDRLLASMDGQPALHEIDLTDPTLGGAPSAARAEAGSAAPPAFSWPPPELPAASNERPLIALMVRDGEPDG